MNITFLHSHPSAESGMKLRKGAFTPNAEIDHTRQAGIPYFDHHIFHYEGEKP